mgnify:CR=1 FL=1
MFAILYYDVKAKYCNKMLKIGRKYLQWVQNSVFEGEISKANYEKMVTEMDKIIKKNENNSLVVYKFRQMKYYERAVFGNDKKDDLQFI